MLNRIVLLLFYCLLLVIGTVMFDAIAPNHYVGVRTAATLSDPVTWYAINQTTGLLIMATGWVGVFVLSLLRPIGTLKLLLLVTASVGILAIPVVLGDAMVNWHHALAAQGIVFSKAPQTGFLMPLLSLLLLGAAGNVLFLEPIRRNRFFGFRLKRAMRDDSTWRSANRVGGAVLQFIAACGVLLMLALLITGNRSGAVVAALVTLLACPLLAGGAVMYSITQQGED